MTIATIHSAFQSSIPFAERLLPSLTFRQKTIAAIATAIFAAIALTAFVYRLFVPKNINIVAHDEIHNRISTPVVQNNPQPIPQIHHEPVEQVIHNEEPKQSSLDLSSEFQIVGLSELPITVRNDKDGHPIYDQTRLDFTDIELNTEQLLDYAVINYKNTTCVEDARIILMGEQHKTPKHRDLEVAIINQFGKDRDVFLLEGTEYEEFIPDPNTNYGIYGNISKKIHMRGWEENLSLGIESLKLVQGINTKKLEIITEEKQSFERGISTNQEKMQKSRDEAFELFHQFMEILHERNNFLIRSIKRALIEHPHSKIFVFAGSLHILEVGVFDLLDHMPENEKCAALIFKD